MKIIKKQNFNWKKLIFIRIINILTLNTINIEILTKIFISNIKIDKRNISTNFIL